jgi:two-component system sensor histidine kinase KdpD
MENPSVDGISRRRILTAVVVAMAGLPALTAVLSALRPHLAFDDDLLLYLLAVIGITLIGGIWPAILAAAASSLVLNWFFTPPLHRWTIAAPQNLLALLLFIALAVTVSGVVHIAARRSALSVRLASESAAAALDRERLRATAAQAEVLAEGNRMRTALLTAVSHDLRTPLASVKASVSTLRQTDVRWSPADQAELLATIEEGADRLNALIGNLLDMSRIHTRSLQPFIRPTALDEVAPIVVRGLDGAECLNFDIPEDLPLLAADPGLLERVLANLVANALRYSPNDNPPTLAASAKLDVVTIEVIDHGPGVPDDKREQILLPFEQLGDQRSAAGVGLGLAVSKGFIEAMAGQLTAEATPGGGLTMRIALPASPSTHVEPQSSVPTDLASISSRVKALAAPTLAAEAGSQP